MKTKIGMMLMGLAVLASCSKENGVTDNEGVIRLGMADNTVTRAAVNDMAALAASSRNVGLYGVKTKNSTADAAATADWTADPLMNNIPTTGINATNGLMSWANQDTYIYPTNSEASGKTNVKFYAYYPHDNGNVSAPATSTAPVLSYTLTGEEDLMWATPVIGSRLQPAPALKFNHQLTQLSFRLIDSEAKFTHKIQSVKIKGNSKGKMNIETGALSDWGTAAEFTLTNSEITMPTDKVSYVTLPKMVMLQPGMGSFEMELTTDDTTKPAKTATVKPLGEAVFKAGKAYLITLRLTGNIPVQLNAEVVPWETGGIGEGVVE